MGIGPSSPAPSRPTSAVVLNNETTARVASPNAGPPGGGGETDRGRGSGSGGAQPGQKVESRGELSRQSTLDEQASAAAAALPVEEGERGSTLSKRAKSKLEAIKTSIREDPSVLRVRAAVHLPC